MTDITKPWLICHELDNGRMETIICGDPEADNGHEQFGLVICDAVRHVAIAFGVPEAAVWEWVDKERYNPTTTITRTLQS